MFLKLVPGFTDVLDERPEFVEYELRCPKAQDKASKDGQHEDNDPDPR
jgi:hypothetical protein